MRSRVPPLFTLVVATAAVLAIAMNVERPRAEARREQPPEVPAPTGSDVAVPPIDHRAPAPSEVAQALYRAFPEALPIDVVDVRGAVVGDFNGDGSTDLAVPARARPDRVAVINREWRNWMLGDPSARLWTGPAESAPIVAVNGDDPLLAIVHGVGPAGWRDADARQAYLLKMPAGGRYVARVPEKVATGRAARDRLYASDGGGFLYWTGARYAWHGGRS